MRYNEQNGPKMTGEQIEAYLNRIGHTGPVTLDLAGLSAIHRAHQRAVPFENLDILAGIPLSLDHEALFDASGNWIMTETDILVRDLPQSVKEALAASPEYGKMPYRDNDAEKYDTPSGVFYRIELSNAGAEVKVDVTEDGKVSPAGYDRL